MAAKAAARPQCVCQICTCGKHKCPTTGHSRISINPEIAPCIGMKHLKTAYEDNYRDWSKGHWIKDQWVAREPQEIRTFAQRQQQQRPIETNADLLAISQPNVRNAVLTSQPNGRFQRLQQYEPTYRHVNDQGLNFTMKTLEMDAITAKDGMLKQKKRADALEEKLALLQSSLLTQNQKIQTKNQIINEINDALENMTMKYKILARKCPALERRIKEHAMEREDWKAEKASMMNELNNIASQKVYEVDKMSVYQLDLKHKLEEKNAMISILDGNIDKLKNDMNVENDTKSKLLSMKSENNRLRMQLEAKQLELSKLREMIATYPEEKRKCDKPVRKAFEEDNKENGDLIKGHYNDILQSLSSLENDAKAADKRNEKTQKLVRRKKLSYHQRKLQRNLKNVIDMEKFLREDLNFVDKAYKCLDN